MAKTYAEKNQESIARYGKTLYERRIEKGQERGFTRSQARGHAREKKGEQAPSSFRPKSYKAPKIEKRVQHVQRGKLNRIVNTNTPTTAYKTIAKLANQKTKTGTETRVYIKVWDKTRGDYVTIYKDEKHGRSGTGYTHGITAKELFRRINDKMLSKGYTNIADALYDVLYEDGADAGDSSGTGIGAKEGAVFTQVSIFILQ